MMVLLAAIAVSCKKDDDDSDNGGTVPGGSRISEWISYDNGNEDDKGVITYENNRVKQILGYYNNGKGDWEEEWREDVEYPDANTIVLTGSYMEGLVWMNEYRDKMTYSGENITEYISYDFDDGNWIPYDRDTYSYSDGLVQQMSDYNYIDENWVESLRNTFDYDANLLVQMTGYLNFQGSWEQNMKLVYEYNGSLLDRMVQLFYNPGKDGWDSSYMVQLDYSGGKVSKASFFEYEDSNWISDGTTDFLYNNQGNIASWEEIYEGDSWKIAFTYASGTGNFSQVYAVEALNIWDFWHPFPTKSEEAKGFKRSAKR
jgi:hypothetical protein